MGIKKSATVGATRTAVLEWEGESFTVVYAPGTVTPNSLADLRSRAVTDGEDMALLTFLADVLVSWEVTEDDGTPIEPTVVNLGGFPIGFLAHVLEGIQEDIQPGEAQGRSAAG
jgi:hypothetical protein